MSYPQLKKLSGSGYTMIPNRIVDSVLIARSKYAADTLALALYLIRHIPGQEGTLTLSGPYSQANICEDLGWGVTNRARLKRALGELEQAGVIVSDLQSNNTVVLHIRADLDRTSAASSLEPPATAPGPKDFLQGGVGVAKIPQHPPRKDFSQATRGQVLPIQNQSLAFSLKQNNEINKINKNHPSVVVRNNQTSHSHAQQDDDVDQLLRLYRSLFKKVVSPAIALSFAHTYWENDRPRELVEKGFHELASNPILFARTTSPNAVWELDFMRKKASDVDARIRQTCESLRYHSGSDEECKQMLAGIIRAQNLNADLFDKYYAEPIAQLFAQREQDRALRATWSPSTEANATDEMAFVTTDHSERLQEAHTAYATSDDTQATLSAYDAIPDATSILCDDMENSEPDHKTPLFQVFATTIAPPTEPAALGQAQTTSAPKPIEASEACPTDCLFTDLMMARSKNDLIRRLHQSALLEHAPIDRQHLETLQNLVTLESISFDTLRALIRQHWAKNQRAA